jgi:hypothetical protein
LPSCASGQLTLAGGLQGATQSLLGTLTLVNRRDQACALPVAPSRVVLRIGKRVLRVKTARMSRTMEPPGLPTRRLGGHQGVSVGIQWRNWCGVPRGRVRLSIGLRLYPASPRTTPSPVRTPVCKARKSSSRVTVSRFIIVPP